MINLRIQFISKKKTNNLLWISEITVQLTQYVIRFGILPGYNFPLFIVNFAFEFIYEYFSVINRTFFFSITGEHCIHITVQNNNVDILKHLLQAGADINARVSYIIYLKTFLKIQQINMTFALKSCDKWTERELCKSGDFKMVWNNAFGKRILFSFENSASHHQFNIISKWSVTNYSCLIWNISFFYDYRKVAVAIHHYIWP